MKSSTRGRPFGSSLRGREPDEVLAALDDKTEAVIREFEAQHKRSLQ